MKDNYADHLRGILSGTKGGCYVGGSLDLGDGWLNPDGFAHSGDDKRSLSEEEQYLVCKIYLKHKSPSHAFYSFCDKFVSDYLAKKIVGDL